MVAGTPTGMFGASKEVEAGRGHMCFLIPVLNFGGWTFVEFKLLLGQIGVIGIMLPLRSVLI